MELDDVIWGPPSTLQPRFVVIYNAAPQSRFKRAIRRLTRGRLFNNTILYAGPWDDSPPAPNGASVRLTY